MGVYTYETEYKTKVPPKKLFKAMCFDLENVLHKAMPADSYKGCEVEGDGGYGTTKKFHFHHGGVLKHMKHKIESIDKEHLSYKYSLVEGEPLHENVEKIDYDVKIEDSGDGGALYKHKSTYHTKGDYKPTEEDLKYGNEKSSEIYKTVEGYVSTHPEYVTMGVYTYENEYKTKVPAKKLFRALVLDVENVLHKALPDSFKGCEVEGDGGYGTIRKFHFHHGGVSKYVKHKIESIDKEHLSYKYSLVEGELLHENVEKIDYDVKIEDSGDGGALYKNKSTYHTKGDYKPTEEDLKYGNEKTGGIYNVVEGYVSTHPEY